MYSVTLRSAGRYFVTGTSLQVRITCSILPRAMTKGPYHSLLGAAIVFGPVSSRAFVCRDDYSQHGILREVPFWPFRKRAVPFTDHSYIFCTGNLHSKHQNIDPSLEDLLQFELLSSISAVPEEDWNKCLCSESSPFMEHSWLRCLEEAGCTTVDTGWMPSHVLFRMGNRVCGFVPVTFVI